MPLVLGRFQIVKLIDDGNKMIPEEWLKKDFGPFELIEQNKEIYSVYLKHQKASYFSIPLLVEHLRFFREHSFAAIGEMHVVDQEGALQYRVVVKDISFEIEPYPVKFTI